MYEKKGFRLSMYNNRHYFITITNFVVTISIYIMLILYDIPIVFQVIYLLFGIPFFVINLIFLIGKIWKDSTLIKNDIISMTSNSYIVCKFFDDNKKIKDIVSLLNSDGKTIKYDNGIYTIDSRAIYYDEYNRPCIHFRKGFPNSLIFDFNKLPIEAAKKYINGESPLINYEGHLIDVIYSSEGLQSFKKDHILEQFHRDPEQVKNLMIMIYILGGIIVGLIVLVIIIFWKTNGAAAA